MRKVISENLIKWRKHFGYSQDKLANYLGIERENISYYESGKREIPIKHLEKISDLFGIEPDMFFNENADVSNVEIAFAFRNEESFSPKSMENIARFKKIVRNYLMMHQKIEKL